MQFANLLKEYRDKHKLSQSDLSKIVGVSPRSIWDWENGKPPRQLMREAIAAKLNGKEASHDA
jgi:DNA-binding XRE family transcriptional regulator